MTARKHFGTDGLRGVANEGQLRPEQVLALGRALGRLAARERGPLVLARDPRRSSGMLAAALAAGAASEGTGVVDLGVLPTPALAALLPALGAGAGAMLSASHNPMEDNGIKVLTGTGAKLADAAEAELETDMARPVSAALPTGAGVGAVREERAAIDLYERYLFERLPGLDLSGLRILVDAANGACAGAAPRILSRLGAQVIAIHAEPDGVNINAGCGAVHPEAMAEATARHGCDAGVAFDGDGDRSIFADAAGAVRDGDAVLYALGRRLAAAGRLPGSAIVGTVMSNFGLELALGDLGIRLVRTPVGDRHVAQALREQGLGLGGEPSGHVIFGADNRFIGDGLYTALRLFGELRAARASLAELCAGLAPVPQVLLNVPVRDKPPLERLQAVTERIAAADRALAGSGRVLVRYSGTENLLRVMVEGKSAAAVRAAADDIAGAVKAAIGR